MFDLLDVTFNAQNASSGIDVQLVGLDPSELEVAKTFRQLLEVDKLISELPGARVSRDDDEELTDLLGCELSSGVLLIEVLIDSRPKLALLGLHKAGELPPILFLHRRSLINLLLELHLEQPISRILVP